MDAMKEWREEEAVVEVALGCVAACGAAKEASLDETAKHIDVDSIADAMNAYEGEAAIQEQACLAITSLAELSDDLKGRLKSSEGIGAELREAEGRITNERNKKYAGRAMAALGLLL